MCIRDRRNTTPSVSYGLSVSGTDDPSYVVAAVSDPVRGSLRNGTPRAGNAAVVVTAASLSLFSTKTVSFPRRTRRTRMAGAAGVSRAAANADTSVEVRTPARAFASSASCPNASRAGSAPATTSFPPARVNSRSSFALARSRIGVAGRTSWS